MCIGPRHSARERAPGTARLTNSYSVETRHDGASLCLFEKVLRLLRPVVCEGRGGRLGRRCTRSAWNTLQSVTELVGGGGGRSSWLWTLIVARVYRQSGSVGVTCGRRRLGWGAGGRTHTHTYRVTADVTVLKYDERRKNASLV